MRFEERLRKLEALEAERRTLEEQASADTTEDDWPAEEYVALYHVMAMVFENFRDKQPLVWRPEDMQRGGMHANVTFTSIMANAYSHPDRAEDALDFLRTMVEYMDPDYEKAETLRACLAWAEDHVFLRKRLVALSGGSWPLTWVATRTAEEASHAF